MDLRFPPAVILVPENRQDIALCEPELLRDGRLVHVQRACYEKEPVSSFITDLKIGATGEIVK